MRTTSVGCARATLPLLLLAVVSVPALAGFAGTDVFLPSVGAKPGVPPSVWYTTVWVHNPNTTPASVTFYLLERQANLQPLVFQDTIQPGDTAKYDNAVQLMFAKETFGAVRITSNVRVIAGSRIYSQSGELKDSVGQYFAAIPATFAIGVGQTTEVLGVYGTQPSGDSTFRYNFGFVEITGTGTCDVRVTARDHTGAMYGDRTYTVRQWEQVQKTFSSEFSGLSTENARLTVEVISGSGRVIAFGSGVANGSQDPATFEMSFRDEILGPGGGGGSSLPTGSAGQTLRSDGSTWLASSALTNDGTHVAVTGNLRLPVTAAGGAAGALFLGGDRFLHGYGASNTSIGPSAGSFSTTGSGNTATGAQSLSKNSSGDSNTAIGASSLASNTSGDNNTAAGSGSLSSNSYGHDNTAAGYLSLQNNSTGYANTAVGTRSLERNTTGDFNTACGYAAGAETYAGSQNTFVGAKSGSDSGVRNATAIGYDATVHDSNHVRIGNALVTEIGGHVGWTSYSDARQKSNIRDLALGLEFVLALRPVSFTLEGGDGRTGMGFLAQEIEGLLGDGYGLLSVGADAERTLSLRYTDFIAPLVRAIQEQQAEIEELRKKLAELQETLTALRTVPGNL